jgi:hypothetical protein
MSISINQAIHCEINHTAQLPVNNSHSET